MVRYVKPMKQKPTTRRFRSLTARTVLVASAAYLVLASPLSVFADRFDDAINGIEGQISSYEQQAAELRARGDTLQNTLDAMTAEKNALQAQIDLNQAKFDKLTADITANEEKLDRQKRTLNKTVAQIYANSDTPAIVVLASARNCLLYTSPSPRD